MNTTITTRKVVFIPREEDNLCEVHVTSNEPADPFFGSMVRFRTFPKEYALEDILANDIKDYMHWDRRAYTGSELIAMEREEQLLKHGFTKDHDAQHAAGQLLLAAKYLLTTDAKFWPADWSEEWKKKFDGKAFYDRAIIAGALIAAEWDRSRYETTKNLTEAIEMMLEEGYVDRDLLARVIKSGKSQLSDNAANVSSTDGNVQGPVGEVANTSSGATSVVSDSPAQGPANGSLPQTQNPKTENTNTDGNAQSPVGDAALGQSNSAGGENSGDPQLASQP